MKRPGCDDCMDDVDTDLMCDCEEKCPYGYKPEGVVVEIADGIIRILDWFGRIGVEAGEDMTLEELTEGELALLDGRTAEILNWITAKTAGAGIAEDGTIKQEADERMVEALLEAMGAALTTIWQLGYEPEEIIKEKHEYNLGRPYRHGGKVL